VDPPTSASANAIEISFFMAFSSCIAQVQSG
jgi:hypothetical protein